MKRRDILSLQWIKDSILLKYKSFPDHSKDLRLPQPGFQAKLLKKLIRNSNNYMAMTKNI